MYTDRDFVVSGSGAAGSGLVNKTAKAENLIIYGTNTVPGGQQVTISGDAALAALAYTPNANATFSGNMEMFGAVVANNITISGSPAFHYDEALNDFFGNSNESTLTSWQEMVSAAEKAGLAAILLAGFGADNYP